MALAAPPAAPWEAPERAEAEARAARSPFRFPLGPDRDLVQQCIHCGLCTTSCPTFALLGNEMDSPRGRVYLMRMVADGYSELTPSVLLHLDRCLDCRACETACPSGVRYGALIEAARAAMEPRRARGTGARLLRRFLYRRVLPSRRWLLFLALLGRLYQRSGLQALFRRAGGPRLLPTRLRAVEPLMPEVPALATMGRLPEVVPAEGEERFRVAYFAGCVQSVLFGEVNAAALRVLSRHGARVETPRGQTCCGALQAHGGDREGARELARRNLRAFDPDSADAIVVAASGCGSILHEYGELLKDDPEMAARARAFSQKVVDITQFLVAAGPRRAKLPSPLRATYHEPCHLAHALKVRREPRAVLRSIEGLELVELQESDWCCGSAGSYNLTQPELSARLLERKLDRIAETGARAVVTGNPGCLIQIAAGARRRGMDLRVVHPVTLLDEAHRGVLS